VQADEGGEVLAAGPPVAGGGLVATTAVPALPAGDYFFLCTFHPTTMTGTLSLSEGGGPTVVAQDLAFDTDRIVLPPDLESTITLDNEDAGTEHNIAIYTDESASEAIFQGQEFPGVATETYTVPAIAPGRYYFHCDVHPEMNGTVEVGAPPEGGGEAPPGEEPPPDG